MTNRICTCLSHQNTLVVGDSRPSHEDPVEDIKTFTRRNIGKHLNNLPSQQSTAIPLELSDSESSIFSAEGTTKTWLSPREEANKGR